MDDATIGRMTRLRSTMIGALRERTMCEWRLDDMRGGNVVVDSVTLRFKGESRDASYGYDPSPAAARMIMAILIEDNERRLRRAKERADRTGKELRKMGNKLKTDGYGESGLW